MNSNLLRRWGWIAFALLFVLGGVWGGPRAALAQTGLTGATITVTSTGDDVLVNNNCTLREAVQAANLNQAVDACPAGTSGGLGDDIVRVPAGTYTISIPGTFENNNQTGDIDILSSLTIQGDGPGKTIIQVDPSKVVDRIFQVVRNDVLVRIDGVTLQNGNLTTEMTPGGTVEVPLGGAVSNVGVLKVSNSAFINNAVDGGASGTGGALYNNGSLEVTDAYFTKNYAGYGGGAIHNDHFLTVTRARFEKNDGYGSGGIVSSANSQTTISDSQFVANQIGMGGGGAMDVAGQITIQNCLFDNNRGEGGTISLGGRMLVKDSRFINNGGGDATITVYGMGRLLTVQNSTFDNNQGTRAGGIFGGQTSALVIENSKLTNNSAEINGGAITWMDGSVDIHHSTLLGNQAQQRGGGLYLGDQAQLFMTESTVSQNTAALEGGGIYSLGQFNIQNSTISGNTAAQGGGMYLLNGQDSILYDSTVTANTRSGATVRGGRLGFVRTILAGNLPAGAPDCDTQTASEVYSRGHNLVGNATGCHWTADVGDIIGSAQQPVNPKLGPLANNGGPTFTHALLSGSPAIDAAGALNCGPTDQRGFPRPSGPACDIGSYELQAAAYVPFRAFLPVVQNQ